MKNQLKIKYLQRLTKEALQANESIETTLEIKRKKGAPIGLVTKLFFKENKVSLNYLQTLFNSKLPEKEIINRLASFLEYRWERIANILPYTRFPDSDITKLYLEIAKFLNQQNPSKKVYQYLMPTVQFTEDKIDCLDRTDIDQYALGELILSENQKSLIPPFEILNRLDTKTDLLLEQITNPFSENGATPLTQNEQRRIIAFSSATEEFYNTLQAINTAKRESSSLGGHIQRLIDAFKAGGEHGGNGGTSQEASTPALAGLTNFLDYWETLPQADKDKTRNLPHSYGKSTYTLGENLIAASFLHDCVEEHAYALTIMLKNNDVLFLINGDSVKYTIIRMLQERFVNLRHEMMASKKGNNKIEWTTGNLHSLLSSLSIERNFHNLTNLAERTTDKELSELCSYFQPINLIKAAQNANDVIKVLELLQRLPSLLQEAITECRVEIGNLHWSENNFSKLSKILDLELTPDLIDAAELAIQSETEAFRQSIRTLSDEGAMRLIQASSAQIIMRAMRGTENLRPRLSPEPTNSTRQTTRQVVSPPNSRSVSSFSFFNEGGTRQVRRQNQEATAETRQPSQWRMLLTSPLNLF